MNKVMFVTSYDILNLADKINKEIEDGWEPIGVPFITRSGEEYAQMLMHRA